MGTFAKIDENNKVIQVLSLNNEVMIDSDGNETEQLGVDFLVELYGGGLWKQTSYNGNFRKNHASIGMTYDKDRDAFIPLKPYDSWTLNEDTCQWEPPTAIPNDGEVYVWNEDTTSWDEKYG